MCYWKLLFSLRFRAKYPYFCKFNLCVVNLGTTVQLPQTCKNLHFSCQCLLKIYMYLQTIRTDNLNFLLIILRVPLNHLNGCLALFYASAPAGLDQSTPPPPTGYWGQVHNQAAVSRIWELARSSRSVAQLSCSNTSPPLSTC